MELMTIGRTIYPGRQELIWCNSDDESFPNMGVGERFRIVLIENGTGIVSIGENRSIFTAPAVLCLNEADVPCMEKSVDFKARVIYFHPEYINNSLTFENLGGDAKKFVLTDKQDSYWLRPFIKRNGKYYGVFNIGPVTAKRMFQLFQTVKDELDEQRDWYWPCRSRSYFLEMLFILERMLVSPEVTEEIALPQSSDEIDEILMYLHTNYQKKITITELCKVFHVNRTTLSEKFFSVTGLSVMTYLIKLRVRLASLVLRDTMVSVSEVMIRTGFNDMTHFGRIFKKYTGYSPTDYRQEFCWLVKKSG